MFRCLLLIGCGACLIGCGGESPNPYATQPTGKTRDPYGDAYGIDPNLIKFQDHVEPNADASELDFFSLQFIGRDGQPVMLKDLAQGRNLVLVVTRGYAGSICPYCSTQVSRLIANYDDLKKRNAEVVVVYPIETPTDTGKVEDFLQRAISMLKTKQELPFPLLLDLELKAVDFLGIRRDLSKPATYILNAEGQVQFAYVGNTLADRPSVQALVEQLDKLNQAAGKN